MNADLDQLLASLESIRQELASLGQRVAALESATPRSASPASPAISPELISVVSAAVAAYLGVKPHIRQIRLISSPAWSQQGRVTIQASHQLDTH